LFKEAKHLAEIKLISPLLSNMEIVKSVSIRGGTSVYIVRSTKTQQTYILKHISVPESQKQVDALIYTGAAATKEDAQKYYEQVVADYQTELETLETLSSSPNIDCYRSYQIAPKEDAVGYDVYLLAEHRKTLVDYLAENAMTHVCAVNLGMDLCSALVDLRAAGLIHRDVKPSNIYLNSQGHFVLGDLGIAKIEDLKYCSMPEHMLSSFSAPELFNLVGSIEKTTDIYSVGLILYRIFNGNHGPFEDEKTSAKAADKLRVTGKDLPAPMYADYEMTGIILKACAFKPEDRYQTPDELRAELVEYMKRNQVEDTLIVPPIVADEEPIDAASSEEEVEPVQFADTESLPEDFKQNFSPDTQMLNSIIESVHKEMEGEPIEAVPNSLEQPEEEDAIPVETAAPKERRKKKRKRWIPFAVGGGVLLLAAAVLLYFFVIAPSTVRVNDVAVVSKTSDSITVHVNSSEKDGAFQVVCADAYGNSFPQAYTSGKDNTFTDLVPGTQYTVSVSPTDGEKVLGNGSVMVSTTPQTNVLSFTATAVTVTQCELNLIVKDGPDPGDWTVSYSADGVEAKTATFSGHSTTIANLESGKEYTFELQQPAGTELTGATTASFSTQPSVDIEDITAALSSSSAILSWTIKGDAPESWTVTITGPNDYSKTQDVTSPTVTFDGLTSGDSYDITISAPTMLQNVTTTITPSVTKLKSLTAEAGTDGSVVVNWACEADPAEDNWVLSYELKYTAGVAEAEMDVSNANTATIPSDKLIPNATYQYTLALKNGDKLDGTSSGTFTTPEADKFTDYNFGSVYVGFYLRPTASNWTVKNLSITRKEYDKDEGIAFAVQSINNVKSSSDKVTVTYVVRDASGTLVDFSSGEQVWNDMWKNNLFAGSFPRTPQTSGTYSLSIYFNGKLAANKDFKVK
jgi:serine/threonine protein kinase